jgi:hypothetical protein
MSIHRFTIDVAQDVLEMPHGGDAERVVPGLRLVMAS